MSSHTSKPSLNLTLLLVLILFSPPIHSVPWTPFNSPYNINQATNVQDPLLYTSSYPNHTYFPSPTNWRFPFYSAMLDRFADGDPSNNAGDGQYGGHETDMYEVNFRFGGDIQGLIDRLDYIRAMGIRGLYIIGAPFLNNAVDYHGYNPLDFTLLDPHFGTVDEWRALMTAAHDRGMYVMMDLTVGTMGDLIEFGDWGNYTSPINLAGYETKWKKVNSMGPKEYWDFKISNEWDPTCQLPQFWGEDGFPIASVVNHTWKGCYKSDFNTFGDIDAFDYEALWRRQITKFNAVQDRLRDWYKPVGDRIMHHACLLLQSLDFDAVRIDKSTQMTNIFLTKFTPHVRACARKLGKTNFLVTGEITAGETFGALFIGRGRQPDKRPATPEEAMNRSALTPQNFLWSEGKSSMDSQAFHYSIYRNMLRFLRLDSNDRARFDLSTDLVPAWHEILVNDDMWNLETGQFDPRHMFGVTNQDTIRWPAFTDGGLRQQLGHFVVNLVMPGIPLYYYGEEQNLYLHDGIAHNYMYGRQSMSSAPAWKLHGCYKGDKNNQKFYQAPFESVLDGCKDEEAQLDHFDTTHPSFLLVQHLSRVREEYAVVRDGLRVEVLGNWTYQEVLPGTSWMSTTVGLWSLSRSFYPTQQQPTNTTTSTTTPLWLLFTNSNTTITHSHPCTSDLAILAPFPAGTTVVNIFPPYDRVTLQNGRNASVGCMPQVSLPKYGYVAYVPEPQFRGPRPTVVGASPPHDARIIRQPNDANHTVPVSFVFSSPMASCEGVTAAVSVASVPGPPPRLSPASVRCSVVTGQTAVRGSGIPVATWKWEAVLQNVMDGVHTVSVAATIEGPGNLTLLGPSSRMFRVGSTFNPIVNTLVDYSPTLLTRNGDGTFAVNHDAAGASMFRLSLDYGKTWGPWTQLSGVTTLEAESFDLKVDGTAHVIVDYWCKPCSSSAHRIHGHYAAYPSPKTTPRRWPSLKIRGDFNDWGEDVGAASAMTFVGDGKWEMQLQAQFPCNASLDVFGDRMYAYGDFDRDGVLDRLPPTYTTANYIHFPLPPRGYLGWILTVDDATRTYTLTPTGVSTVSVFLFFLLALLPIIGGIVAVKSFENISYGVLFNMEGRGVENENGGVLHEVFVNLGRKIKGTIPRRVGSGKRLKVLIGTLEYDIPDWNIKVRIGGLGAIAGLMAKHMIKDKDLVWVVPKLGDVEYPEGEPSPPIEVTVLGRTYEVGVQLHTLEHLTYVLLDAGIFRARVKKDPYPARMDDLESAVLYSVWNQCIAAAMERFAVDVYHINDYHGALAPLYLLPKTIPCCLSLHNAAFQGLWPIRTRDERRQVCSAFNLRKAVVTKYIQFGNTFNLLHAAASYLRIHQNGVGCVGVSSRYATRVLARYPTLWGLSTIGSLPNPNPVDFGADGVVEESRPETVGTLFRKQRFRIEKKLEAQRWAHLKEDPDADLVVFVGRWSHQKGIDLIADLAPRILQEFPKVQLLCVGPIVDLHGKLAASKLQYLMEKDPDRVFSKAEFTSLPQAVFQGCDFVLIPSRDEPFGLVAVEFGRFGALGIGSFVGGLGSMPGWWFPIESAEVEHLLKQFWKTIKKGLNSPPDVREKMRSTAQKQRFPVEEWLEDLDDLYTKSIKAAERPAIVPPQAPPDVVSAAQNIEQEYTVQLRDQTDGPSNMTERQMSALSQPSQWPSMRRRPSKPPVVRFGGLDDIDEVGEMDEPPVLPWMARSRSRPSFSNQPRPAFADTIGRSTMSHPELALSPTRRPVSELSTLSNSTMNNDSILDDDMDGKTISFMPYDNYDSNDEDDLTPPPTHHLWPLATSPNFSDTLARANPHTLLRNRYSTNGLSSTFTLRRNTHHPSVTRPNPTHTYYGKDKWALPADALELKQIEQFKDYGKDKPFDTFNDEDGAAVAEFERNLKDLTVKSSTTHQAIDTFLTKTSTQYFQQLFKDRLHVDKTSLIPAVADDEESSRGGRQVLAGPRKRGLELLCAKIVQKRLGDWPVYSIFLTLGQLLSATSFQLVLLTGGSTTSDSMFYKITAIFLLATVAWTLFYRHYSFNHSVSLPFFLYAVALFLVGAPNLIIGSDTVSFQEPALYVYAFTSASGSLFFGLNFGEEADASTRTWVARAGIVEGGRLMWVSALWYWGKLLAEGVAGEMTDGPGLWVTAVCWGCAVLFFGIGGMLHKGLPDFYRASPPSIPAEFRTLFRRKLVIWFLLAGVVQSYWLSAPYGRNWSFLWETRTPAWTTALLLIFFFIGVWGAVMGFMWHYSKVHSWLLPIFAVGLMAPRWAQMWWGTSGLGLHLSWAGAAGPYLSTSLWLWLGVLDSVQQVGLCMMLLQTLTRLHLLSCLMLSQFTCGLAVILARLTAPDRLGPGDVFPNPGTVSSATDISGAVGKPMFWLALVFQLVLSFGYLLFFRREQLSRP